MSRITTLLSVLALLTPAFSFPVSGTTYSISPASFPDLCVAPAGDSEGSKLIVTSCENASSEIAWVYNGQSLLNSGTDMCVDITDGTARSGNTAQVWDCYSNNPNQHFSMGGELIKWSSFCLDLTDGKGDVGTVVQIWSCFSENPNQQWVFNEVQEIDGCDATTNTTCEWNHI